MVLETMGVVVELELDGVVEDEDVVLEELEEEEELDWEERERKGG